MPDPTPSTPSPTIITVPSTRASGESGLVKADGHPIEIRAVHPLVIVLIRAAKVYLQTLTGLVAAGAVTDVIPYTDFFDLVWTSAGLSVAAAGISVLTNLTELLARLDQKYPSLTS